MSELEMRRDLPGLLRLVDGESMTAVCQRWSMYTVRPLTKGDYDTVAVRLLSRPNRPVHEDAGPQALTGANINFL